MRIFWPVKITNERVRELVEMDKISRVIKVRRWKWIGHVLRSHPDSYARTALTWTLEGRKRKEDQRRHGRELWRERGNIWDSGHGRTSL
jgi:hypothetical protein